MNPLNTNEIIYGKLKQSNLPWNIQFLSLKSNEATETAFEHISFIAQALKQLQVLELDDNLWYNEEKFTFLMKKLYRTRDERACVPVINYRNIEQMNLAESNAPTNFFVHMQV